MRAKDYFENFFLAFTEIFHQQNFFNQGFYYFNEKKN